VEKILGWGAFAASSFTPTTYAYSRVNILGSATLRYERTYTWLVVKVKLCVVMNSNRPERQTDDDVQAIKSGSMLPNIQTLNFSVGDESIHFQHNLKVPVRFPKSHSVQALVVS